MRIDRHDFGDFERIIRKNMRVQDQKIIHFVVAAIAAVLLTGCTSVPKASVQGFSTGVSAAKAQTDAAFQAVADLTSQATLDYAAAQPALNDACFQPVLDPKSIAVWDNVFSALEKYSQSLMLLSSPTVTKDYEDAAVDLAGQIKQTGDKLKAENLIAGTPQISPSFAAAFTELGNILLQAKAEHDVRKIALQADPKIRAILTTMADVLGASQNEGLRGTVHANWDQKKGKLQVAFLNAKPGSDRRSIAGQYADFMNQQALQDVALSELRNSLLALAAAHHALAQGQATDLAQAISALQQAVQNTMNLAGRFQTTLK